MLLFWTQLTTLKVIIYGNTLLKTKVSAVFKSNETSSRLPLWAVLPHQTCTDATLSCECKGGEKKTLNHNGVIAVVTSLRNAMPSFDEGVLSDVRWAELLMEQKQKSWWAVFPGHVSDKQMLWLGFSAILWTDFSLKSSFVKASMH